MTFYIQTKSKDDSLKNIPILEFKVHSFDIYWKVLSSIYEVQEKQMTDDQRFEEGYTQTTMINKDTGEILLIMKHAIIVDDKEVSNIRDLSSFEETNYSYRYEIDVTFKFDIIKEPESYGLGERVEANIEIKDSYLTIEIGA